MDDADLIDWYDIVEAVANGRLSGHRCPACQDGELSAQVEGSNVTIRCQACSMGFQGRLAHGRDDGFYAEAVAMEERAKAKALEGQSTLAEEPTLAEQPTDAEATQETPALAPEHTRPEPWSWELPAPGSGEVDVEALSVWMPIIEAVHNGRRSGLNCPFCSEPLADITVQRPYIRVRCGVCNEAFEGRLG